MAKQQDVFRRLYREPLSRTRNRTIWQHDRARKGAAAGGVRFEGERAREMQRKGLAARLATSTPQQRSATARAGGLSRTKEQRSILGKQGAAAQWSRLTPEERRLKALKMRIARYGGAPWPFPVKRVMDAATRKKLKSRQHAKRLRKWK